ncbi:hypothetical protein K504DRAFT_496068 [Pleomassaria siparia CBS 279.74]|uniref:Uncharacterized protein n=1 Tax=Pleomassaria siparia CBS 279.74 TaxID=1314801 RepID=A0A6G1JR69_9PLEO|nr:hypothetical protein K504DRAFT_496068 [Pleomassaria siparia CBS 279.74]
MWEFKQLSVLLNALQAELEATNKLLAALPAMVTVEEQLAKIHLSLSHAVADVDANNYTIVAHKKGSSLTIRQMGDATVVIGLVFHGMCGIAVLALFCYGVYWCGKWAGRRGRGEEPEGEEELGAGLELTELPPRADKKEAKKEKREAKRAKAKAKKARTVKDDKVKLVESRAESREVLDLEDDTWAAARGILY